MKTIKLLLITFAILFSINVMGQSAKKDTIEYTELVYKESNYVYYTKDGKEGVTKDIQMKVLNYIINKYNLKLYTIYYDDHWSETHFVFIKNN